LVENFNELVDDSMLPTVYLGLMTEI